MSATLELSVEDGIAVITIDDPGEEVNTLKLGMAREFEEVLERLARHPGVSGLILRSGKPEGFVAGADLTMLRNARDAEGAKTLSRTAQAINDRIESLALPTVAAIHGAALGGGLELALACSARVASDAAVTRLGLPEVQLGLIPGGGGTQRLTERVGLEQALPLMLTGRQLRAGQALALGLVDRVVPPAQLLDAAREVLRAPGTGPGGAAPRPTPLQRLRRWLVQGNPLGRALVMRKAREGVRRRGGGHYPAPEALLQVVATGLAEGRTRGLAAESEAFGELAVSAVARNLIGLFFDERALRRTVVGEARPVTRMAVIGAGLMGAGIAEISAVRAGLEVGLHDRDEAAVSAAIAATDEALRRRERRGALLPEECAAARSRLRSGHPGSLEAAELVIEAVPEDLTIKHQVLERVEAVCAPDTLFASNTSSLPLRQIAERARRPGRVLGMHYFSPVQRMPLLEVVRAPQTTADAVATAVAVGRSQGKTVIVVEDGPGFYTSRILAPYLNEAARLLAEGVAVDRIDQALVAFGFPVGPFALLDEVGLDVAAHVAGVLTQHLGERMRAPDVMAALEADARLGRKNGRGFYVYGERRRGSRPVDASVYELLGVRPDPRERDHEVVSRCVLQMVNEVALCVDEGIVHDARDADVGAVFGLGFPPFRGGPLRYVDARGAGAVVAEMRALAERLGDRFDPAPLLLAAAQEASTLRNG